MAKRIAIFLSAHGFGHIGQTAPVVDALRRQTPDLDILLFSDAPAFKLTERFGGNVTIKKMETDVGFRQIDALTVDIPGTLAAYAAFHSRWQQKVDATARELSKASPDLILSNISYLGIAASDRIGVPAIALCSLDWYGIFTHFFPATSGDMARIATQILDAYRRAHLFFKPEPSMPMTYLERVKSIGPIAQVGRDHRSQLRDALRLSSGERLLLISLGGMEFRPPIESWPRLPGIKLIVPASWRARHPDCHDLEDLGLPFLSVLASCDALLAKPGYGSFVEAAVHGIPILYLERPAWPEAQVLIDWLSHHGRCDDLPQAHLQRGAFSRKLDDLCSKPAPPRVSPTGADDAASLILATLDS